MEKSVENDRDRHTESKWFCVLCKAQQEKKALVNLVRQKFEVYLPLVPSKSKKTGQSVKNLKPMFPGYLFVEADALMQDLSVIRSTIGCVALLHSGSRPAVVPNGVMSSIKKTEFVLNDRFSMNRGFKPGNKYELLEQGFQGHTATFLALEGEERARVLVTLLNSEHEVKIMTSSLGQERS